MEKPDYNSLSCPIQPSQSSERQSRCNCLRRSVIGRNQQLVAENKLFHLLKIRLQHVLTLTFICHVAFQSVASPHPLSDDHEPSCDDDADNRDGDNLHPVPDCFAGETRLDVFQAHHDKQYDNNDQYSGGQNYHGSVRLQPSKRSF